MCTSPSCCAARIAEDRFNCELIAKEDVALQQLVLMAMGDDAVVVAQACKVLACLGQEQGAARKLIKHDAVQAISSLVAAADEVRRRPATCLMCYVVTSGMLCCVLGQQRTSATLLGMLAECCVICSVFCG